MKVLILGLGNPYRSDDGVGVAVARGFRSPCSDVDIKHLNGEATAIINAWEDYSHVIICDAACAEGQAQTPFVAFQPLEEEGVLQKETHTSSHGFGLSEAIKLGKAVGQIPDEIFAIGIYGQNFAVGDSLSPQVVSVIPQVQKVIQSKLKEWGVANA